MAIGMIGRILLEAAPFYLQQKEEDECQWINELSVLNEELARNRISSLELSQLYEKSNT